MYTYPTLIALHSWMRWLVLLSLLFAIARAYRGWLNDKPFTRLDNFTRHTTATIVHIQFMIAVWLYFISPVMYYFMHHYGDASKIRDIRFFGMEHSIMMLVAIVIITIGSAKAKRRATDKEKFKTMAVWFTIGLVIILLSIPWPFSPYVSRPFTRPF